MKGVRGLNKKILSVMVSLLFTFVSITVVSAADYEYDALGRLIRSTYSKATNEKKTAAYSYDKGGNITNVSGFSKSSESSTETTTEAIPEKSYVWNYSTGENTEDFFSVSANNWSNVVPVTYGDMVLNKAVKMESDTLITFNAPKAGKLTLVTYAEQQDPTIVINDPTHSVSKNGAVEIDLVNGGNYRLLKGTTNTYLYYMKFETYKNKNEE